MGKTDNWLLLVRAEVDPSVESEWNQWYDEVHLPEILKCPGFKTGRRFRSVDHGPRAYLTVYELDRPDAVETIEFKQARGWGKFGDQVTSSVAPYEQRISTTIGNNDE